jgi:hypothetical protein
MFTAMLNAEVDSDKRRRIAQVIARRDERAPPMRPVMQYACERAVLRRLDAWSEHLGKESAEGRRELLLSEKVFGAAVRVLLSDRDAEPSPELCGRIANRRGDAITERQGQHLRWSYLEELEEAIKPVSKQTFYRIRRAAGFTEGRGKNKGLQVPPEWVDRFIAAAGSCNRDGKPMFLPANQKIVRERLRKYGTQPDA